MKETMGEKRRLDKFGRINIPRNARKILDIEPGSELEFFLEDDKILLKKHEPEPSCIFCNSRTDLKSFQDKQICKECILAIKDVKK